MNRRQHATLARLLIEACGGLAEAEGVCRLRKSRLAECQDPHGEAFMPADVMADLESHCGRPIYSAALTGAVQSAARAKDLLDEACEAAESVTGLQRKIRLAASDGVITPRERDEIARDLAEAESQLREVGEAIARTG